MERARACVQRARRAPRELSRRAARPARSCGAPAALGEQPGAAWPAAARGLYCAVRVECEVRERKEKYHIEGGCKSKKIDYLVEMELIEAFSIHRSWIRNVKYTE